MYKYCDLDKWASEVCGSQHDGESCENCNSRDTCENYRLNHAFWCMHWDGGEDEANW